jgi:ABC-type antimicrobial peptide transport system permease subunit
VLRLILGEGGRLAVVGIAVGALAAAVVGRVLESLLYGVSSFDPIAYASAAALLFTVAFAANLVPALTASRIDPIKALKVD